MKASELNILWLNSCFRFSDYIVLFFSDNPLPAAHSCEVLTLGQWHQVWELWIKISQINLLKRCRWNGTPVPYMKKQRRERIQRCTSKVLWRGMEDRLVDIIVFACVMKFLHCRSVTLMKHCVAHLQLTQSHPNLQGGQGQLDPCHQDQWWVHY